MLRLARAGCTDSIVAHLAGLFVLIGGGGLLGLAMGRAGPAHQWIPPWDTAALLAAGWRIRNGQIPHTDYFSYHDLHGWITALGLWLTHDSVRALTIGALLVAGVSGVWGWIVASRRLSTFGTLLFVGMTMLVATGVVPEGTSHYARNTSYAMQYNRFGLALLNVLALQLMFRPLRPDGRIGGHLRAISAGILLALLLSAKINFFLGGMALLIGSGILFGRCFLSLPTTALAFFGTWGFAWIFLGLRLDHYLSDVQAISGFESALTSATRVMGMALHNVEWFLLLFVLFLIGWGGAGALSAGRRVSSREIRLFLAAFWAGCVGCLVVAANSQGEGPLVGGLNMGGRYVPLFAVAALMIGDGQRRLFLALDPQRQRVHLFRQLLSLGLTGYFVVRIFIFPDLSGILYALHWQHTKAPLQPAAARIPTSTLETMLLPKINDEVDTPREVLDHILFGDVTPFRFAILHTDGIRLLEKHVTADSRILALAESNLFPLALHLPPPRGGTYWFTFTRQAKKLVGKDRLSAMDRLLDDATLLMEPKFRDDFTLRLRRLYGTDIARLFEKVDESPLWTLYRRKSADRVTREELAPP